MKLLVANKKAHLNYEILEKYTAGVQLFGYEVKSLKNKHGNLLGAYVIIRGNEAFLVGATIPPYQPKNTPDSYDTERPRKLLLKKKEIEKIAGYESQKGLTVIPIALYNIGDKIKLQLGIAKGKKQHDKREDIKKRDSKRDIERETKQRF